MASEAAQEYANESGYARSHVFWGDLLNAFLAGAQSRDTEVANLTRLLNDMAASHKRRSDELVRTQDAYAELEAYAQSLKLAHHSNGDPGHTTPRGWGDNRPY